MMVRTCFFNVLFQLHQKSIMTAFNQLYNSSKNIKICLLEVAMCEKWRSSHFQLEGGSKKFEGCGGWGGGGQLKILGLGGGLPPIWGVAFAGGSVPHYMPCILTYMQVSGSPMTTCINTASQCLSVSINSEKGRSAF